MNILVIDNFDSFIYNFVDSIEKLDHQVTVVRNSMTLSHILDLVETLNIEGIVISPGPGKPEQAGICVALVKELTGRLPIFGICLGHQAIASAFAADVIQAKSPIHGKRSNLKISRHRIFRGFEDGLSVGRYHSLIAKELPVGFELLASCDDEIQAMIHSTKGLIGFQFHPESVLTLDGDKLISNVLVEMQNMALELNTNNCLGVPKLSSDNNSLQLEEGSI
jgi:anthranilate synthase component II